MKESIQHLFTYIIFFIIVFLPSTLHAENVTMTAVGEYVMGDNDTYTEAKKLALQDAKRILLEKVGTYIESKTEVKDGIVNSDEIKQYTAGIVKVEEISDERSVLANKASVVKVNVKAIVDPDALIKQVISFRNRKDVEESAKRTSADNYKLRKEIEQLNQQLRNVADEKKYQQLNAQRKEILEKIDTNEKGLKLLLSGEGLYAAALFDRQKKDEGKQIVRKFIQALPSAYKITVSKPEVDANGDGTANMKFKVNVELDYSTTPDETGKWMAVGYPYHVSRMPGVDFKEFWSTGLDISSYYPYVPQKGERMKLICEKSKCIEIMDFVWQEFKSKPLFLYVTVGQHNEKRLLVFHGSMGTKKLIGFGTNFDMIFAIKKMPLSELKEISQIEAKILYLERSAFPEGDKDFKK